MLAKYESMWEAYLEKQSINYVHKVCEVSYQTARRAVRQGWPRFNKPPLATRWIEHQKGVEADLNAQFRESPESALKVCREAQDVLGKLTGALKIVDFKHVFSQRELKKLGPRKTLELLKTAIDVIDRTEKLKAFLGGKPTVKAEVEHTHKVQLPRISRIHEMGDDELDVLIARVQQRQQEEYFPSAEAMAWADQELARHATDRPLLPASFPLPG